MSGNSKSSLRVVFQNRPYLFTGAAAKTSATPANSLSVFTYQELTDLYGLIQPLVRSGYIAATREDIATFYDNADKPNRRLIGTSQAMRDDSQESLIFYINKHAEQGRPDVYEGALLGNSFHDRVEFEASDFKNVLGLLKGHLHEEKLKALQLMENGPPPSPQG